MLIDEIARMAGLSVDAIRDYEEFELITSVPVRIGSSTYRGYDRSLLDMIERIRGAQQLGFSLEEIGPLLKATEIRPLLKAFAESPPSNEVATEFLENRLSIIREKIASLFELENSISRKLDQHREWRSAR